MSLNRERRALLAAGVPVDVETVLIGAGLEFHNDRERLAGWIPEVARDMERLPSFPLPQGAGGRLWGLNVRVKAR